MRLGLLTLFVILFYCCSCFLTVAVVAAGVAVFVAVVVAVVAVAPDYQFLLLVLLHLETNRIRFISHTSETTKQGSANKPLINRELLLLLLMTAVVGWSLFPCCFFVHQRSFFSMSGLLVVFVSSAD